MKPTTEILEKIKQNSKKNPNEVFTRLYRYLLRTDIYYLAYKNLYANNGASTKGVDDDTADGFSEAKIQRIIQSLSDESYEPKPARRTYRKKSNGKMRPLGIPTFTDKIVQEVLRMILEAVYEPFFQDCSHGFRPNRSCHTALKTIKKEFNGIRWFVEGDIKGCFDNINHQVLVDIIGRKIKDARIIKLIYKFLKAGYMENWKYHNTYSGTPQGGIISPIFANIYLNELDKFVMTLKKDFDRKAVQVKTTEYNRIRKKLDKISVRLKTADEPEKLELLKERKLLRSELVKTPCKSQTDKKIKYIRYADDFIIGVNGNHEDCEEIKRQLSEFISTTLKMELSEEKTLITHSNTYARFLGYDIRVRRSSKLKYSKAQNVTQRTLNNTVELCIPLDEKIMRFMFEKHIIEQKNGKIKPRARNELLRCTELEIVSTYNSELRGICNYYSLASNFNKLNYFSYLMEYSCLKTLGSKSKSSTHKIIHTHQDGTGRWCISYKTKSGEKNLYFADYRKCKNAKVYDDTISNAAVIFAYTTTNFEDRLAAKVCELCGTTESNHYEIHHVNKVKNLKGKAWWEQIMIAKRRKTIVVCQKCHKAIHNQ